MSQKKRILLCIVVSMIGVTTWAQTNYPKFEAAADFSLVKFNPSTRFTTSHDLFGGGGSLTYNFTKFVGIKADFQGYGSQTNAGTIPAGTVINGRTVLADTNVSASGTLFTYLFGPQFKYRTSRFEPFGEVLFGGAYSTLAGNLYRNVANATGVSVAPNNNAFAMEVGGGLDIKITPTIAIRPVQIDYLLTRFGRNITGTNNQNSFHYAAGIVFRFGGTQ